MAWHREIPAQRSDQANKGSGHTAGRQPTATVALRMQRPGTTLDVARYELLDQQEMRIIMRFHDTTHTNDEIDAHRPGINLRTGMIGAVVATAAAVGTMMGSTAVRAEPQGYLPDELAVGYTYGTFDQSPNITLLVGGTAEEFCLDNPDDPFDAGPGLAPLQVFLRNNGAVDLKANDKDQPIHLYHQPGAVGPEWIERVCADFFGGVPVPEPFASGTADLKVRISVITDDLVDVFNSVNGKASASDGTEYKVRASADLVVRNGVPVGDPSEFVHFQLTEIKG